MGYHLALVKPWKQLVKEFGTNPEENVIKSTKVFTAEQNAAISPHRLIRIHVSDNPASVYMWIIEDDFKWISKDVIAKILPGEFEYEIPRNYEDMGEDES